MFRTAGPFSALVFDLDGTILRSHELIARTINLVLEGRGHSPVEAARVMKMSGLPLELIFETVLPAAQAEQATACVDEYRTIFDRDVVPSVAPIPGAPEAIVRIADSRRWPLAIATGRLSTTARAMLRTTGLEGYFASVVGIDLVPRPKPYPDVLVRALEELGGVPAQRALMIGDTTADIAVSRSAGVPVCAVTWGAQTRGELQEARPDWCVDTWAELLILLDVSVPAAPADRL